MEPHAKIRKRREALGVSQFRFARQIGVTSAQLSAWELGKVAPSAAEVAAIEAGLQRLEEFRDRGGDLTHRRHSNGSKGRTRKMPPPPGLTTDCCGQAPVPPTENRDAPVAVALFAGAGGMARGFSDAGFNVKGFVESSPEARATFKQNFRTAECLGHDILQVTDEHLQAWQNRLGDIDVLIGGPPCQGFSLAGKRNREDPRNLLFEQLLHAANIVRPAYIVMENVRLLLSMRDPGGGLVIDRIMNRMRAIGYTAEFHIVNAQDYGVPQFRERVFVVAARADSECAVELGFPAPTHMSTRNEGDTLFGAGTLPPLRTFRDATGDLASLESGESDPADTLHWAVHHPNHVLDWLRDVPEGGSAHDNADPAKRPPSGYNTTYKRLRWDEPGSTIGTTFGMISASKNVHPENTRALTVREAARIQSFPDDFIFEGNWGDIRTMIGNAVPPRLAEAIASYLLKRLPTR